MSSLACGRATRHGAIGLVVLALAVVALPILARPAPARADLCSTPIISTGCDVVDGVTGALGDAGDWIVHHVKKAVEWTGDHVGPVLKTLAAAGIAVGAWVACSKVAKALGSAGGAAAGGVATDGAGTAEGEVAGAAATGAVCEVLKKGGKLILNVGKKALANGGALSKIAKLAAAATGLAAIVYGTDHAAAWVLENLLDIDGQSGRELGDSWVAQLRSDLNGAGGVLLVLAAIMSLGFAAVRGSFSDSRRILGGVVGAAVAIAIVGSVMYAAIVFTDAITNGVLHSHWGQRALGNWRDLGDTYAQISPLKDAKHAASSLTSASPAAPANGTPPDDGGGPWLLRLLIAAFTVFFGALVWVELQIREGALLLLLIFSGLVFTALASPRLRELATGFATLILGVVVAKLVIVVTLLVGGSLAQNAAAGASGAGAIKGTLLGLGLMGAAAFLGWWTVSWLGLHGAGALAHVSGRVGTAQFALGRPGGGGESRRTDTDASGLPVPSALASLSTGAPSTSGAGSGWHPEASDGQSGTRVEVARQQEQRRAAATAAPEGPPTDAPAARAATAAAGASAALQAEGAPRGDGFDGAAPEPRGESSAPATGGASSIGADGGATTANEPAPRPDETHRRSAPVSTDGEPPPQPVVAPSAPIPAAGEQPQPHDVARRMGLNTGPTDPESVAEAFGDHAEAVADTLRSREDDL